MKHIVLPLQSCVRNRSVDGYGNGNLEYFEATSAITTRMPIRNRLLLSNCSVSVVTFKQTVNFHLSNV